MPDADGLYIRIRRDFNGGYVWEMLTRDRQIVAASDAFPNAAECTADAEKHKLRIIGAGQKAR